MEPSAETLTTVITNNTATNTNANEVNRRNFSAKEKLKFNDTIIEINENKPSKINDLVDGDQHQNDDQGMYDGEMTDSEYQIRY